MYLPSSIPLPNCHRRERVDQCLLSACQAFQPAPHAPTHLEFYTHFFQVRSDEVLYLAQVFQVAALVTQHMCDMSAPYTLTTCFSAVLDPDFYDERLCTGL